MQTTAKGLTMKAKCVYLSVHEEKIALPVGRHCLGEFYGASSSILDCEESICRALQESATQANAKLLKIVTHRFEPQGVTGFALLAESHISIHTWPELNYATVDAFTCGTRTWPDKAIESLKQSLKAKTIYTRAFDRDYVSPLQPHRVLQGASA
ncbi:adenosylmethionine decarboxylase [bacterium]|nr:adenosylmethionine decarboxylase [bacterium]